MVTGVQMKKVWLCAGLVAAVMVGSRESSLHGDPHYTRHRSERFNYEIIVPTRWQTDELSLEKKHIFISYRDRTEIKVRAFVSENPEIDSTIRKRSWNLRAIDPLLNKILETEKISVKKNVTGKLLVFEYRSRCSKILQRTMITRSDTTVYIIDCKSPVGSFYRNEEAFNIALSSFKLLSGGVGVEQNENGMLEDGNGPAYDSDSKPGKTAPRRSGERKDSSGEEHFFDLE